MPERNTNLEQVIERVGPLTTRPGSRSRLESEENTWSGSAVPAVSASTRVRTCSRVWRSDGRSVRSVSMGSVLSKDADDETLAAVRELLPTLRARAADAEAQRKVP